MEEKYIYEMLSDKFFNSDKKTQINFIKYCIANSSNKDNVFEFLDNKKLFLNNRNESIGVGDNVFIYAKLLNEYKHRKVNSEYYLRENLIIDHPSYDQPVISVYINSIDPVSNKVGLKIKSIFTDNITIESVLYISQYEILDQIKLELVI